MTVHLAHPHPSNGYAQESPPTPPTVLAARSLTIGYRHGRRVTALAHHLDLALQAGELVCLLGPNGAGKSTLMRTLAGLQPPLEGQIILDGVPLHRLRPRQVARRLSVVLTERVDVGNLSAYALVALGRHPYTGWTGTLTPVDEAVVAWALQAVGATHLAARSVLELSDGERQKVMIARALAQEPLVMLLDEPTAFLDLPRRVEIMDVLGRLTRDGQRAVLLSTHDLDLALRTADRLWLMAADGTLQVGVPEDLVLSGAFQRVFAGEGVHFDPTTGAFQLHRPVAGVVWLHGQGVPALWTARGLERVGYRVITDAHPPAEAMAQVWVHEDGDDPRWRIRVGDREVWADSVAQVLAVVRASGGGPRPAASGERPLAAPVGANRFPSP